MVEQVRRVRAGWWGLVVLLLLSVGAAVAFWLRPRPPIVAVEVVRPQRLVSDVFASGTVRPVRRQILMPTALPAPVTTWYVHAGDHVRRGQLLAQLDNAAQRASLASARVAYQSAQAMFNSAQAQYRAAPPGLKPQFLGTLESARTQLAQARAQLAQAQAAYDATLVRAAIDGSVLIADDDGMAADGTPAPVLEVASDEKQVVVAVGQVDAVHLKPGMLARLQSDSFPGVTWTGRVASVAPYAGSAGDASAGQVAVTILPRGRFPVPYGYQVDVHIRTAAAARALAVPYEALVSAGGGYAVFVVQGGRVREVPVTLGLTTDTAVQVVHGLRAGDAVVLNPPPGLVNGEAVRVT
ncbi:macrolide export protein MacA [Alicyclobacillus cellulosilyticus]|uniref:Macrolide export protein MacA n=1 Tax=Alicyclobacillus cellulosilyticus TaxID=1003997 RepID=A0A917K8D0_9BACL|nr:efflux RND transporter periplasmic adaptor subunit [Alicyclobacillus cellulosilyticus]GGJ01971.1 macrolide export protein MacA [Alicyclobacillus cellulosilyticus]